VSEPTIYDAVEAPDGYGCQMWHDRSRDEVKPCQNDGAVLFVYDSAVKQNGVKRRNCIGCMECAPVRESEVRDV